MAQPAAVNSNSTRQNSTRQVDAARERDTATSQHSGMLPLIALLCALAVGASAWFFYHQGQRDALASVAIPAAASDGTATAPAESAQLTAEGTPATTMVQTPSYGKPDIIVTTHPSQDQTSQDQAASAASPKPAAKARVAKAKTMMAAATKPLDREVALSSRPQPVYPAQALRTGEQGTVLVLAQVDVNGQVSDARVVRHSGSSILDRAAPNEVRRWKFQPALHDGRPVAANVEVPVSYKLDQ